MTPDIDMRQVHHPSEPYTADSFLNGHCYDMPDLTFTLTNTYHHVGRRDNTYLKVPSEDGRDYHWHFLFHGVNRDRFGNPVWLRDCPIRYAAGHEVPERMDDALTILPPFPDVIDASAGWDVPVTQETLRLFLHYLVIHRLHYETIKSIGGVQIPQARFVFLRKAAKKLLIGDIQLDPTLTPAIVQQVISGTSLWDMYKPRILRGSIAREWRLAMPRMASQLIPLLESSNIDWNPQNFIYCTADENLYYVGSKPTTFSSLRTNEHNLLRMKRYFVTPWISRAAGQ